MPSIHLLGIIIVRPAWAQSKGWKSQGCIARWTLEPVTWQYYAEPMWPWTRDGDTALYAMRTI